MYLDESPNTRDHLRTLTGRCTSLRHLALRSADDDFKPNQLCSASLDEVRYVQWATFIVSVGNTLRTFGFEQGIPPQCHSQGGCSNRTDWMPLQVIRPMHERYFKYIAPVLVHGSWPEVKKVVSRALGGSVQNCYIHNTIEHDLGRIAKSKHRLQQALEPNVLLTFEREATKTFYHIRNLTLNVARGS